LPNLGSGWQVEGKPHAALAISIQVADEQQGQLEELLQALMHPQIAVMVHLDAKAPAHAHASLTKLITRIRCPPHPEAHPVHQCHCP
jgi:hypothetical protein